MVDKTLLNVKYEKTKRKVMDAVKTGYGIGAAYVGEHKDEVIKTVGGLAVLGVYKAVDHKQHCRYYDRSLGCYVPTKKDPRHLSKRELQYICKRQSEGAKLHDIYGELGILK